MKALYLKDADSDKRNFTAMLAKSCKADFSSTDCRLFTPTGTSMSFSWSGDEVHSMLFAYPAGTFEAVAFSPQNRVFANTWGQAFLEQVNRSLATSGLALLPFYPEREAQQKGFWSLERLRGLFGQPQQVWEKVNMAQFGRSESFPHADSVLAWYFRQYGQLFVDYNTVYASGLSEAALQQCRDFLIPTGAEVFSDMPSARGQTVQIGNELQKYFGSMNYSIGGINYKSALLTHCIRKYFDDANGLRFLDMGGGPGFLAAELLLADPKIKKAVNVDISTINLVQAKRLFCFYRDKLAERFYMCIRAAQDFEYDDAYDVISFIGSLLYVPRDKVQMTLQRAWDALNPGGILIIHENIKSPAYAKDYDVMFTVDELKRLLGGFGDIDYYLSTAALEVPRRQIDNKSVFRVVRKS